MPSDIIPLARAAILCPPEEASYVVYGARELQNTIERMSGITIPYFEHPTPGLDARDPVFVVGARALDSMPKAPKATLPADLGEEGYTVRRITFGSPRKTCLWLAGGSPQGTKWALIETVQRLYAADGKVSFSLPATVTSTPAFAKRGMYAHLHWAYANPYSLRTWSLEQWKEYVDLLTHLRFNLLQIWTMVGLLPTPLSDQDAAYLQKYRDLIDYAHQARGMEVWVGDGAANVAGDVKGIPIERREYFDIEVLKNPADPSQFAQIMASRENVVRLIPNADAYWIIDSDPGRYPDSPSSELVRIFAGQRALIDRYGERPGSQPLVYWMWWGWGTGEQETNCRDVVRGLRDEVAGPVLYAACNDAHLRIVREEGVLSQTIYFPYGAVEQEPSPPLTMLHLESVREHARLAAQHEGLIGIMGNAQSPLVQWPNIYALSRSAWNPREERQTAKLLRDLARLLLGPDATPLAEGWEALATDESHGVLRAREALAAFAQQRPEPGPVGSRLVGGSERLLDDLALLLAIRGNGLLFEMRARSPVSSEESIRDALHDALDAVVVWTARTGYHGHSLLYGPYKEPIETGWLQLRLDKGASTALGIIAQPAVRRLKERHTETRADSVVAELLGDIALPLDEEGRPVESILLPDGELLPLIAANWPGDENTEGGLDAEAIGDRAALVASASRALGFPQAVTLRVHLRRDFSTAEAVTITLGYRANPTTTRLGRVRWDGKTIAEFDPTGETESLREHAVQLSPAEHDLRSGPHTLTVEALDAAAGNPFNFLQLDAVRVTTAP